MTPFIIYALPRSRTAWISAFLTYGEWTCHHDQAIYVRSMDDVRRFFATPNIGTVETGVMQGWWLIHHYVPGIRAVVIRRPVEDAIESMLAVDVAGVAKFDEQGVRRIMTYGDRMLDRIGKMPGVLQLGFDDLATEDGCCRLFEFCLPYRFDEGWWMTMSQRNIQIDVKEFLREYFPIRDQVEAFKRLCFKELLALRRRGVKLEA
jgi:hypothetical protein